MAEPLKTFFSPALVRKLADDLTRVRPTFPSRAFIREATRGLDEFELLDRGKHIATALAKHLPPAYSEAIVRRHRRAPLSGSALLAFHKSACDTYLRKAS